MILVVTPLVAHFADRLASRKTLQYASLCAALFAAYPAFWALTHGAADLVALVVITAYVAIAVNNAGASSVLMLEAFPKHRRAAGLSVIYSFGVVIFGGFSPLIVAWLTARHRQSDDARVVPARRHRCHVVCAPALSGMRVTQRARSGLSTSNAAFRCNSNARRRASCGLKSNARRNARVKSDALLKPSP